MAKSEPLNSIQHWMQTVITHPEGVRAGIASADAARFLHVDEGEIERVILPSREMSSLKRLEVYGHAYFGRLIECLRTQYPAVRHAVGDEAFDGLAGGYLIQYPSTSYTLGSLGDSFEGFLAATRPPRSKTTESDPPDFADFLVDLARLERVYGEVFDGQGAERSRSLEAKDFEGLSPEAFVDCRLVPHACVRLLEFRFPVHEYASAIRLGTEPVLTPPRPVSLVVTRRDYIVRRFEVSSAQFELLSALNGHETVGESIQKLCLRPDVNPQTLVTDLRSWFRDWSAAPLFTEIVRGTA